MSVFAATVVLPVPTSDFWPRYWGYFHWQIILAVLLAGLLTGLAIESLLSRLPSRSPTVMICLETLFILTAYQLAVILADAYLHPVNITAYAAATAATVTFGLLFGLMIPPAAVLFRLLRGRPPAQSARVRVVVGESSPSSGSAGPLVDAAIQNVQAKAAVSDQKAAQAAVAAADVVTATATVEVLTTGHVIVIPPKA